MLIRVLPAARSPALRGRLERLLQQIDGIIVLTSATGRRLLQRVRGDDLDLLVLDRSLLGKAPAAGIQAMRGIPDPPDVVVVAAEEDFEERATLLTAGCLAVLNESLSDGMLVDTLRALVERVGQEALQRLRAARPGESLGLQDFVSDSPAMKEFITLCRRVVATDSSLLMLGETGVGKERLARAIHVEGPRSGGPFIAVNCGALPEGLLESELFGHEQGAFTGATRSHRGHFELAHGGTIFLDEVGEVPLHLQVKLLRVLEDRRIRRVGGERLLPIDVRIIAATNRDLEQMVREGRFRQDLYYRMAVVTLALPALRERREDIPHLLESYFLHFRTHLGRQIERVRPEAMEALARYGWPGNVRELINVMERAVLLCGGNEIGLNDLPRAITGRRAAPAEGSSQGAPGQRFALGEDRLLDRPLRAARREAMTVFEGLYLDRLLRSTKGSIGGSARRAGINARSLYDLMRRHGLRKETYKRA
jgi:DNA-binding NtrC family response regulator